MARQRDYKAEYQRRLARGRAKGYSGSVARGHAPKSIVGIREARKTGKQVGSSKIRATGREIDERTFREGLKEAIEFGANARKIRKLDIHDEEGFIKQLLDLGLTPREAYTLRFSP